MKNNIGFSNKKNVDSISEVNKRKGSSKVRDQLSYKPNSIFNQGVQESL